MEGRLMIMLMFFLLSISFASSDQSYIACNPRECGGINITYPFYVAGQQPSYCGFPGFQVSCKKNLPLLNLSGDTYIIKEISYTDQTLWIVNSAFNTSTFVCITLSSVHNLTLKYNNILDFNSKPNSRIVLLQGCSAEALQGLSKIMCKNTSDGNSSSSLAAVYDKDLKLKQVAGECRWAVSVPYEASDAAKMEDKMRGGFALKWIDNTKCQSCQRSGGRCVYNQTAFDFLCSCSDMGIAYIDDKCLTKKDLRLGFLVGGIILALILGAILIIVICCIKTCIRAIKTCIRAIILRRRAAHGNRQVEEFIRNQESMGPKRYTYTEIKKMTMKLREKLGEGGFSVVYKGKLFDGRLVAVKMLKQSKAHVRDFINEVASISRTNHVNVVTLLGYFFEGRKRGLVYEFMPNGSLEKFTRAGADDGQLLPWETLFQIALGIARGLEYLHIGCNTRILHFDIKPHNILLGEGFCPKISDFGLAKLCPQTEQGMSSTPVARGTIGYIAPEVFYRHFGDVSHKSDVYSYGMMVLEVIGCRGNANAHVLDPSSSEYFPHWIYKKLNREEELEGAGGDGIIDTEDTALQRKLILVSLWCIQAIPSSRPSMGGVVQMLEGSVESIEVPPIPIFASPPRPQADLSGSSTLTNDSSFEIQGLEEIPLRATRNRLGVCHSFPADHSSCYRDPISTLGFTL